MVSGTLVKVLVGTPQQYGSSGAVALNDRVWTSAIFKQEVSTPLWLGRSNLEGDQQADTKVHGGPEKAVLCYSAEHYSFWQAELGAQFEMGGFGENLVIAGMDETQVCIGDIFHIGSQVVVQVSEARMPCWKLGRRWNMRDLPKRAQDQGKLGWYCRVLREGLLGCDNEVLLVERPLPRWTIAAVNHQLYVDRNNLVAAQELAECMLMSEAGREVFRKRVEMISAKSDEKRLYWRS